MKTLNILLLSAILLFANSSFGQKEKNLGKKTGLDHEKIQAEKISFLTNNMVLTVEEAQVFWPLYNEHHNKMTALHDEEHKLKSQINSNKLESLSDKEVSDILSRLIANEEQQNNLKSKFYEDLKSVLTVKKIALFYDSEMKFRKYLLNKYRGD